MSSVYEEFVINVGTEFEDGRLQIKFYNGTELEVEAE